MRKTSKIIKHSFEFNAEYILEKLESINPNAVILSGEMDRALIGISETGLAVYERNLIVDLLMRDDNMEEEEAIDYFYYNICSLAGENMPIFVDLDWEAGMDNPINIEPKKKANKKNLLKNDKDIEKYSINIHGLETK